MFLKYIILRYFREQGIGYFVFIVTVFFLLDITKLSDFFKINVSALRHVLYDKSSKILFKYANEASS